MKSYSKMSSLDLLDEIISEKDKRIEDLKSCMDLISQILDRVIEK